MADCDEPSSNTVADDRERNLASLSHLLGYLSIPGLAIVAGVILGMIGPMTIWLRNRTRSEFIEQHARESLSFQISLAMYSAIAGIFWVIGHFMTWLSIDYGTRHQTLGMGALSLVGLFGFLFQVLWVFLLFVLVVYAIVCMSSAMDAARQGKAYRYRFTMRLIQGRAGTDRPIECRTEPQVSCGPSGHVAMSGDFPSGADETWEPGFSKRERDQAMLCHLLAIVGYFVMPLGNIIYPLIVWRSNRNTMPFVRYHGKQSLNFQLTITAWYLATLLFIFPAILIVDGLLGLSTHAAVTRVMSSIPGHSILILIVPLACVPLIIGIVLPLLAVAQAGRGRTYRYPISVRFIK